MNSTEEYERYSWKPEALTTIALERLLTDALADLWRDYYRRGDEHDQARRRMFRRQVQNALYAATGEEWELVR